MTRFFVNNTELLTKHEYDSTRIGENLIKGSALGAGDAQYWFIPNDAKVTWGNDFALKQNEIMQDIPVKPNTTYTFSWVLKWLDAYSKDTGFYFIEQKQKDVNTDEYVDHRYTFDLGKIENSSGLHVFTFTTQSTCNLLTMHIRYIGTSPYGFKITRPKLEVGSVATPWCISREDYARQSDISALQEKIAQLENKIGGVARYLYACFVNALATSTKEAA